MRKYLFLLSLLAGSSATYAQQNNDVPAGFQADAPIPTKNTSDWIVVYADDGLTGFLNSEGKEIVPPIYERIHPFGEYQKNWARVETLEGLSGFIDTTGKIVVEPGYDYIETFGIYKDDWALVSIHDKYGFINARGEEVVAPIYAEIPLIIQ